MTSSPALGLPYIQPSQAQKHVTHNEALDRLDAVVQLTVLSWGATAPPAAPVAGDVHAVGPLATGAWSGADGQLAAWDGAAWAFTIPREGWRAWDRAAGVLRVRDGGAWKAVLPPLQNVDGVGVNAAWDAANRLTVASAATLLSHAGAGHQVKVNKAAPGDTASLLFQSAFTGHAEMGLSGGLDFALKVSDGAAWSTAVSVARATGRVTLPQGATIDGGVTGTAVQAGPADATAGRLLLVGAFGLGGLLPAVGNAAVTTGSLAPGLYAYDTGGGSTGGPTGVTRGMLLHTRRAAGVGETQLVVVEAGSGTGRTPGQVLARARTGGNWGPWICGSVTESGSGANGSWVRHQNGVQECWHGLADDATAWATASGALFTRAAAASWTYPMAFSAAPVLSAAAQCGTMGAYGASAGAVTATTGAAVPWSSTSLAAGVAKSISLTAVGRWY